MSAVSAAGATATAERLREERAADLGPQGLELRDLLDEFAAENPADAVVQAAIPAIVPWARWRNATLAPAPDPLTKRALRPLREGIAALTREDPSHPSEFHLAGEALFQADGPNHLRPAEPIMRLLGDPARPPASVKASKRATRTRTGDGISAAQRLLRLARDQGVWVPADVDTIYSMAVWAGRMVAHAEAMIAATGPEAVAVLATTNIGPRALVHAARRAGVPSVYFPHSSALMDPTFNDLPTDYAGVRGEMEVDYYLEVAGSGDRIEVVGDPSMSEGEMPALDPGLPPVFAPPVEEDWMRECVELVRAAIDGDVIVSPHPHADMNVVEALVPSGWEIWGERTYELLRRGPPLLMQFTSGVALEALSLGIPTIELQVPPGRTITYRLIREPHVRVASDADGLAEAVRSSRERISSFDAREELRSWARGWSHPAAEEAADRGAGLIRRASGRPPPGPIWSAWPDPA